MKSLTRKARNSCATVSLLLLTGLLSHGAAAHDIDVTGVARLFLTETTAGRYRLSIVDLQVPPLRNLEGVIPARCEAENSGISSYGFRCDPALDYDDSLSLPWNLSGVVVLVQWQDGSESSAFFRGNGVAIEVPLAGLNAAAGSRIELAGRYLLLGFEHILLGLDHLLFVLGLLLLLRGFWKLVQTITAFTIAHSLTLGAAVLGYLPAASAPIETVIALSIVLLAREIITAEQGRFHLVHRQPWIVAFVFGLFHGFGFAGALGELGLHSNDIPFALLFFNLGVEAGQLAFVGFLLMVYAVFRNRETLLSRIPLRSLSGYGLGGVAMFWFLQRLPSAITL
ncbi:MAG: HupE/UreJ family protein [Pseudohongiellaceae bacterium]